MYKKRFIDSINKCKICLSKHEENAVLVEALSSFTDQLHFYDTYIMQESPFTMHFKDVFENFDEMNEEECFSIYEDLVIMVREKQLRLGAKHLTKSELALLKEFKLRNTDEESLAYRWFYEKLPSIIVKEIGKCLN